MLQPVVKTVVNKREKTDMTVNENEISKQYSFNSKHQVLSLEMLTYEAG
jgi:hypothetical protein